SAPAARPAATAQCQASRGRKRLPPPSRAYATASRRASGGGRLATKPSSTPSMRGSGARGSGDRASARGAPCVVERPWVIAGGWYGRAAPERADCRGADRRGGPDAWEGRTAGGEGGVGGGGARGRDQRPVRR